MEIKINENSVTCYGFAFDGCHKIYLLETDADVKNVSNGYKVLPVEALPETFYLSCPLRFINNWSLTNTYVRQCAQVVTFEIEDRKYYMNFKTNEYNVEKL